MKLAIVRYLSDSFTSMEVKIIRLENVPPEAVLVERNVLEYPEYIVGEPSQIEKFLKMIQTTNEQDSTK